MRIAVVGGGPGRAVLLDPDAPGAAGLLGDRVRAQPGAGRVRLRGRVLGRDAGSVRARRSRELRRDRRAVRALDRHRYPPPGLGDAARAAMGSRRSGGASCWRSSSAARWRSASSCCSRPRRRQCRSCGWADLVVGADGASSAVRTSTVPRFRAVARAAVTAATCGSGPTSCSTRSSSSSPRPRTACSRRTRIPTTTG